MAKIYPAVKASDVGDIKGRDELKAAYDLGKSI